MSKEEQGQPDTEIVAFLEKCLAAAKEGRVLVGVVSLGILGEKPGEMDVDAQAVIGQAAGRVHPESLAAAVDAVTNGAGRGALVLTNTVAKATNPSPIILS